MPVSLKAYCRGSKPNSVHRWDADPGIITHEAQIERLVHDATKLAEEELGKNFKPPILVVIENIREVEQPTPEPEPQKA